MARQPKNPTPAADQPDFSLDTGGNEGQSLLQKALDALRPFAHLSIPDGAPDTAHPAFQIQVAFIRAARECFPADFAVEAQASGEPLGGDPISDGVVGQTDGGDGVSEPESALGDAIGDDDVGQISAAQFEEQADLRPLPEGESDPNL